MQLPNSKGYLSINEVFATKFPNSQIPSVTGIGSQALTVHAWPQGNSASSSGPAVYQPTAVLTLCMGFAQSLSSLSHFLAISCLSPNHSPAWAMPRHRSSLSCRAPQARTLAQDPCRALAAGAWQDLHHLPIPGASLSFRGGCHPVLPMAACSLQAAARLLNGWKGNHVSPDI